MSRVLNRSALIGQLSTCFVNFWSF